MKKKITTKRKISKLFSQLCCSRCKADFDEKSVDIMRNEDDEMLVLKLVCQHCGKSFGVAFLGISDIELKVNSESDESLRVRDCETPITVDEVLDAHEFIQSLDGNWSKYIAE